MMTYNKPTNLKAIQFLGSPYPATNTDIEKAYPEAYRMVCPRCKENTAHKVLEYNRYYFECSNCQFKILLASLQKDLKNKN